MKCLSCTHNRFKKGTTVLPIERGNAILLITDIAARVCENCSDTYLDEETAPDGQEKANARNQLLADNATRKKSQDNNERRDEAE